MSEEKKQLFEKMTWIKGQEEGGGDGFIKV